MIYKSGNDLLNQIVSFCASAKILYIYSAYIKLDTIKLLLDNTENVRSVFVRWQPKDLLSGSSDLEVFPYLKSKSIALFMNPRIHLKVYLDNYQKCLVTSANISSRALNIPPTSNYNYEIGAVVNGLVIEDKLYFKYIESESLLVTDDVFDQIRAQLADEKVIDEKGFNLIIKKPDKDFLVSSLPMSFSATSFVQNYFSFDSISELELGCMIHDLSTYKIPLGLTPLQLHSLLYTSFFNHNFIKAFLKNLDASNEIYFGAAKAWIQSNCTNVPVPRRWELTENIQILFRWIVELGDGLYQVDRPNYSERLWKSVLHDD